MRSFIYVVEIGEKKKLVRHKSPGRALRLALEPYEIHRATAHEVADLMEDGIKIINAGHEEE